MKPPKHSAFISSITCMMVLAACSRPQEEQEKREELTICKSFSFIAPSKLEITEARKQFYDFGVHHGAAFSDDIQWLGPAIIRIGNSRFLLRYQTGNFTYLTLDRDYDTELTIQWDDGALASPRLQSFPCADAETEHIYETIKAEFSERWKVTKSSDARRTIKLSSRK